MYAEHVLVFLAFQHQYILRGQQVPYEFLRRLLYFAKRK
jgi:hypothetical protein